MTPGGRLAAAIDLLIALEAAPRRPADAVAHDFFRARRFVGAGDRRAIAERAWGVVRQRVRLDWWLARAGATPTARLLAGAHALLADAMPLELLRRMFAADRYAPPPLSGAEVATLSRLVGNRLDDPAMPAPVRLNLPDWALPGLTARFGADLAREAAALEVEAPLDLRVNLLRGERDAARTALAAEGIDASPTRLSPWGLRIARRVPITAVAAYRSGLVEVQDEGSQLVALLVGAKPGMRVCDFCAGAGGKTLALAAMMGNRGRITACDVSEARLEGAMRRLARAGVDNAERHLLTPGDRWAKRRAGAFDRVLIDAPCTGTGTWRRNPDARWRLTETDLNELVARQSQILDGCAALLRPGGRLVYATCSLLPAEDEAQVQGFLERHPEYALVPLATAWTEARASGPPPGAEGAAHLLLTPAGAGTDGFFAAVLERRA